jgi:pentatricopeptide repeat protein
MQREGVQPNAHTFTTIINACTQAQDLERGLQVLHRMVQCSSTHDVGHTSITPYTNLIRACGKALDVEKAFQVLHCMLDVGVKPNVVTFNCLIDACGKAQQLERALQAFKLMQNCYVTPDTITYTALIEACAKMGEVDRAYEFLVQMRQSHMHPNSATCTILLEVRLLADMPAPTTCAHTLVGILTAARQLFASVARFDAVDACSAVRACVLWLRRRARAGSASTRPSRWCS